MLLHSDRLRHLPILLAAIAIALLLLAVWSTAGSKMVFATLIGLVAGFVLYHSAFGFTSHWRQFLQDGLGHGLRMQLLLIGLASLVTFPLIAYGDVIGVAARGSVAPVSVSVIVGAGFFGFGMMFAGGCGSGTLFTVGGGSSRMLITLGAFITGSVIATLHVPWWRGLPSAPRIGLVDELGPIWALVILLLLIGAIWYYSTRRELRLNGGLQEPRPTGSILRGPWSLTFGALGLAAVSIATLALLGRPWGITSAFTLWGAKAAALAEIDVASWPYWQNRTGWLERTVLSDATSVMNFGIIGGALLAANLAGKFSPTRQLSWSDAGTAILGGLCMGYGARIAYGCNIGAYLGGMISGSLHGFAWMLAALVGSAIALRLKTGRGYLW